MEKKLWPVLRAMIRDPARADIGLYATSGAYYLFLSLGPLIVLLLSILPHTPLGEAEVMEFLLGYTPEAFRQLVYMILSQVYIGSPSAFGLSLAAELWSAGKFVSSLIRGIGELYDSRRVTGFLRRRLIGSVYTLGLILFILANLVLRLFGQSLLGLFPALGAPLEMFLDLRWPLFLLGFTLVNTLLFCLVPRPRQKFLRQLPGAALAASGWLAFSGLYSFLVERFEFFSVYGSLAITILSLFWMYCSLYILFLGAWFNTQLANIRPFVKNNNNPVRK